MLRKCTMIITWLVLYSLLFLIKAIYGCSLDCIEGTDCEISYKHNISRAKPQLLSWYKDNTLVTVCYVNNNVCINSPYIQFTLKSFIEASGDYLATSVQLKNVTYSPESSGVSVWSLKASYSSTQSETLYECKLQIYTSGVSECNYYFTKDSLILICSSTNLNFQHKCLFHLTTNKVLSNTSLVPEYSFTNRSDQVNYSMNCSVEIEMHALRIGKYDFNILIYPDLQNVTAAQENGVMYNILVLIDYPSVRLSGCVDKVGKDNTITSCNSYCCRTDKSDVPSLVGWYLNDALLNQSQQCVELFYDNLTNSEYSCQAVNLFGWKSSPIVYSYKIQEDDGMPEEFSECSLDQNNLCSNQTCYNVNIYCFSEKNGSCIFSTIDEKLVHNLCSQNKHSLLFLNGNKNCTVICKELIYSSNNHQAEVNQKLLALLVILPLIIFIVILCACRNKINQRCRLHLIRRRSKKSHDTLLQLHQLNKFTDHVDFDTLGKEGTLVKNMKEFFIKTDQASLSELDDNCEEETML